MHPLAQLDHRYIWHPFTQMQDWLKREPIVIVEGRGAVLRDSKGREYLDANSSIWTNLHGHSHPKINAAIQRQLKKIAHSSALGFANEPASVLAAKLVEVANQTCRGPKVGVRPSSGAAISEPSKASELYQAAGTSDVAAPGDGRSPRNAGASPAPLAKVFFSDDGSTAMEVALKLAYKYARRTGQSKSPRFLSLQGGYHGDTVGAVSLGHINLFHKAYGGLLFKTVYVLSPYCYRCRFNRARPERADARDYRKCNCECVSLVEKQFSTQKKKGKPYSAFVVEPLMQGAAGMIPQPPGWLRQVAQIARSHRAQLIADEVMTGFGRTGFPDSALRTPHSALHFACHHEGVQPDFLALAK